MMIKTSFSFFSSLAKEASNDKNQDVDFVSKKEITSTRDNRDV